MTQYGVTPGGFVMPALNDIVTQITQAFQSALGQGVNAIAPSIFSQIIGIVANREFVQWQAQQAVYNSQYPNTASNQSADNVASITGTKRGLASFGTVTLSVNLNAGVTLPSGQVVSAGANTATWATTASVTNTGGSPANFNVPATCQTSGPIQALATTLTTIVTPFSGWNSVTNPSNSTPGTAAQTDSQLRASRAQQLALAGNSSVNALRAHLLAITDPVSGASLVPQALVYNNNGDTTNSIGLPPHSINAVVQTPTILSSTDALIAASLFAGVAGDTNTVGAVSNTVIDSQGFSHTINFDRPTATPIYISVNMTTATNFVGAAAVKTAMAAFGANFLIGQTVVANQFIPSIYALTGVTEITGVFIGTTPNPSSSADILMGLKGLATFSTANMLVNGT